MLCAPGGSLVWAVDQTPAGLTEALSGWLAAAGFTSGQMRSKDAWVVGRAILSGPSSPYRAGVRWFDSLQA